MLPADVLTPHPRRYVLCPLNSRRYVLCPLNSGLQPRPRSPPPRGSIEYHGYRNNLAGDLRRGPFYIQLIVVYSERASRNPRRSSSFKTRDRELYVTLKAINTGHRPVKITKLTLALPTGKSFLPVNYRGLLGPGNTGLPVTLSDGETAHLKLNIVEISSPQGSGGLTRSGLPAIGNKEATLPGGRHG